MAGCSKQGASDNFQSKDSTMYTICSWLIHSLKIRISIPDSELLKIRTLSEKKNEIFVYEFTVIANAAVNSVISVGCLMALSPSKLIKHRIVE